MHIMTKILFGGHYIARTKMSAKSVSLYSILCLYKSSNSIKQAIISAIDEDWLQSTIKSERNPQLDNIAS